VRDGVEPYDVATTASRENENDSNLPSSAPTQITVGTGQSGAVTVTANDPEANETDSITGRISKDSTLYVRRHSQASTLLGTEAGAPTDNTI
jgi:hypothetical protein